VPTWGRPSLAQPQEFLFPRGPGECRGLACGLRNGHSGGRSRQEKGVKSDAAFATTYYSVSGRVLMHCESKAGKVHQEDFKSFKVLSQLELNMNTA